MIKQPITIRANEAKCSNLDQCDGIPAQSKTKNSRIRKIQYIKCILCDEFNTELFLVENNYKAVKCKSCGLVYVNPRPAIREIKKIYESHDSVTSDIDSFIKLKEKRMLIAKRDINEIRRFKKKGRILEIGSAAGYFLLIAKNFGFDVYGLDINEQFVQFSRNKLNLNVQCGTILDCSYSENFFDIIYMRQVLSHLSNPIGELLMINRMLKNKGLFVFETGNAAELNPRQIKNISSHDLGVPEHLLNYSRRNIFQLLDKTNFRLIKKIEYSIQIREKLYNMFGKRIRSSYKELKSNASIENSKVSFKQKCFARLDLAVLSLGRILPKNTRWLSIIYICQKL